MKKFLIYGVVLCSFCWIPFIGFAGDKGPPEMILKTTVDPAEKPKTVPFPHNKHQEKLKCGDCHHGKDKDGNKVEYFEGMEVKKCESCHNRAAGMPEGLQTFKDVAHKKCKGCHKTTGDKMMTKCSTCHPKKK